MSCGSIKAPIHALRGLHGPADPGHWPWDETAFNIIRVSKTQAVLVLTGEDIDHRAINELRNNGVVYIKARIFNTIHVGEDKTLLKYVQEQEESIERLYAASVYDYTIANEPNLDSAAYPEGYNVSWFSGKEFGNQFIEAVNYLTPRYPKARWGFPATSPGGIVEGVRADSETFLKEAHHAIIKADYITQHTYWGFGKTEADSINEIRDFCKRYNKLVYVTEFGNGDYSSKDIKAQQYVNFYRLSKRLPRNFGGAFSYVMSASSGFDQWNWRDSAIPETVGAAF